MARRRPPAAESGTDDGRMPAALRCSPSAAEFDDWLDGDQMPADWDFGGEAWWRKITAHCRWSRARHAWRVEHDRSYWWYWRSRDLAPPPREQRAAYAREVTSDGSTS